MAGRFGLTWPSPSGWTEFRPFHMFRSGQRIRDAHRRQRDGRRRGETTLLEPGARRQLPASRLLQERSSSSGILEGAQERILRICVSFT